MIDIEIVLRTMIQLARLGEEVADVLERAQSGEEISADEWIELREGLELISAEWNSR